MKYGYKVHNAHQNISTFLPKREFRYNENGTDLNRNFPDQHYPNVPPSGFREKETLLVMKWLTDHQFILSANLHGGALLANYPYDSYAGSKLTIKSKNAII